MIKKINWQIVQIIGWQWVIFALLSSTIAIIYLSRDRSAMKEELDKCNVYQEQIMNQAKTGRIIIDLKGSDETR